MGVKGLMQLIDESASGSFKLTEQKHYFQRLVAIDASTQLYAFLVQVRSMQQGGGPAQYLTNEEGEITSHLQGFFNRAARLLEVGIKPVFVFDGKPPTLKGGELARRRELKDKAEDELKVAEAKLETAEKGSEDHAQAVEDINKAQKRSVKVTREQNDDVKKLLTLMGLPIVNAPCEAEAQCAELCKQAKVWATATEDMDALAFGTPILLRKLTSNKKDEPIIEIHLELVLERLGMTQDQFVDLCILCGCDYCDSIPKIGPKTALKMMQEFGSLEAVLDSLDPTKFQIPENLVKNLDEIRALFKTPDVTSEFPSEFEFNAPQEPELLQFLVEEKGFSEDRVKKVIERLNAVRKKGSQMRLDSFFGAPKSSSTLFKSVSVKAKKGDKRSAAASPSESKKRGKRG